LYYAVTQERAVACKLPDSRFVPYTTKEGVGVFQKHCQFWRRRETLTSSKIQTPVLHLEAKAF